MNREPIWSLEHPETNRLIAQGETLDQILLAAATIRDEDGEDLDGMVVMKAGRYDAAATGMIQTGMLV